MDPDAIARAEDQPLADQLPEIELWTQVIIQALDDLGSKDERLRRHALAWITSRSHEPCSFNWVCQLIDVDPSYILGAVNRLMSGLKKNRPGGASLHPAEADHKSL